MPAPAMRWLREQVRDVPPWQLHARGCAAQGRRRMIALGHPRRPAGLHRRRPAWGADDARCALAPDHWLLIGDDGRIAAAQPDGARADAGSAIDHRGRLLLPGFIDTHVHSPQLDVIASYGTELLDWLNTYTFPAERGMADPAVARPARRSFLDALLAHGTTAAVVFPTVHKARSRRCSRRPGARHAHGRRQGADGPPCPRRPARRRGAGRARLRRPDRSAGTAGAATWPTR
jgi:hypothetical protein